MQGVIPAAAPPRRFSARAADHVTSHAPGARSVQGSTVPPKNGAQACAGAQRRQHQSASRATIPGGKFQRAGRTVLCIRMLRSAHVQNTQFTCGLEIRAADAHRITPDTTARRTGGPAPPPRGDVDHFKGVVSVVHLPLPCHSSQRQLKRDVPCDAPSPRSSMVFPEKPLVREPLPRRSIASYPGNKTRTVHGCEPTGENQPFVLFRLPAPVLCCRAVHAPDTSGNKHRPALFCVSRPRPCAGKPAAFLRPRCST